MSGLSVNTAGMDKNGKDTVNYADEFSTELKDLNSKVVGLNSIWRGSSANEFNKSFEAQAQNFQEFQQLLNELGGVISKNASDFNRTEEENANAGAHLFERT